MRTKRPPLLLGLFPSLARAEAPRLFLERSFSAADLSDAVNHFIALGERRAVRELRGLAPDHSVRYSIKRGFSLPERVGWVCRVLFRSKADQPLRPPLYGANSLPHSTMPLSHWPLYPVVASGESLFVLTEGYTLFGAPEDPTCYLAYCQAEGIFRTQPVPRPTRAQAQWDAAALRQSPEWRAIKWKDRGECGGYTISEEWIWRFIEAQADTIK